MTSELTTERDAFFLVFKIREGQVYRFGEVAAVTDVAGLDVEEFAAHTRIVAGDIYTPKLVDETVRRMEFLAAEYDMPFIRAEPELVRDDLARIVDINFHLVRDSRIFVERIEIEGNTTTLDRVIRRQFDIVEGDPFNPREIEDAGSENQPSRLLFVGECDDGAGLERQSRGGAGPRRGKAHRLAVLWCNLCQGGRDCGHSQLVGEQSSRARAVSQLRNRDRQQQELFPDLRRAAFP